MDYGAIDLHTKESEIRIVEADGPQLSQTPPCPRQASAGTTRGWPP